MKKIVLTFGVLLLSAIAAAVAYVLGPEEEAALCAIAIGCFTLLVVGGGTYLVIYAIRMKQLDIPADELADNEVVWARTSHAVHYRTGNTWKFWETVGGRLFLTSAALEFRANSAEWWVYRIKMPLEEIRRAEPCAIGFLIPGGLRVERRDGSYELFAFGAAFDVSREWANAILAFRDDLEENPC
jgi:hypothetical protein